MAFPAYFGQNWDALEDCLTDLEWLTSDRVILLYEQPEVFAQHDPAEWEIALDILRSTVEYWHERDRPLYILFQGNHTDLVGLKAL